MVAFGKDQAHFNYRVAGVAIHDGHVLLDRNSRNTYWVLPGGHPEMMEPMTEALQREFKEEIGADIKVIRMLWVMENFFHKSKNIHELSFYFMIDLDPDSILLQSKGPFFGKEHNHQLTFQWFPINQETLANLPLFPGYLSQALLSIPEYPQHILFNDFTDRNHPSSVSNKDPKTPVERLTIS